MTYEQCFLSHSYNNKIWCFIPVTILNKNKEFVILRISCGSKIISAKDNCGNKIKLGHEGPWDLGIFEWSENDLTYLIPTGACFALGCLYNIDKKKISGYYINFQRPFRMVSWGYDTLDLELDMVGSINKNRMDYIWKYKDQKRFDTLIKKKFFSSFDLSMVNESKQKAVDFFKIYEQQIKNFAAISIIQPDIKKVAQFDIVPDEVKNLLYESK